MLFRKNKEPDFEKLFIGNLPWYPVLDEERFRLHPLTKPEALQKLYQNQDGTHIGLSHKVRSQLGLNWFYLDFYRCRLLETYVLMTLENPSLARSIGELSELSRRIQTAKDLTEELSKFDYSQECRSAASFARYIHEGVFAALSEELRRELDSMTHKESLQKENKTEPEAEKEAEEDETTAPPEANSTEQRSQSLADFFKQNDIRSLSPNP